MIIGRRPVIEALKSGAPISRVYIAKGSEGDAVDEIIRESKRLGIDFKFADARALDSLAGTTKHQGLVALLSQSERKYYKLDEVLSGIRSKGEQPFLVLLDGIEDPHNLGAILRSADGAGAHAVIIPQRGQVGLVPSVAKTSAGAVEYVPVVRVTNLAKTIEKLKEDGIWIAGATERADKVYYEAKMAPPIGIVIGSEGEGISRLVLDKCDFLVKIPMKGRISSLNASVTAAILMYESLRQSSVAGK